MRKPVRAGILLTGIIAMIALYGCASSKKPLGSLADQLEFKEIQENLRFDNTGLTKQILDMNSDGIADLWKFSNGKQLVRKELDMNFDNRIDRVMFYNAKEKLIREEIDTNFDGTIDRIYYYDDGVVARTEFYQQDCNIMYIDAVDGYETNPDVIRFYRKGKITREESDVSCDGVHEMVTIFDENGDIAQIGEDKNGDGIIEHWFKY